MAFGYNRITGSAAQIVGDLIAGADPQRDTKIDFENNKIDFVVGGTIVASITPNQFSASVLVGNGSSLSGVSGGAGGTSYPLNVSGTSAEGVPYNNTVSKITFDNNTGFQVSQSAPNEVFLSIGSHYKDIVVAGQTTLSATGSDSLELKGLGGVSITTSLIDSNANGILKEVTFSTTELSSSLNTRISTLEFGKFPSSSLSIPYYDNSVVPSVIAPPSSGNREGKVLAWLNDGTIGWKAIVLAASVLNTQYMEAETSAGPLVSPIYLSITTGAIG
jgi:hypothetical protein